MNANDLAPLTERDIAEYLIKNPGFFQRNPMLKNLVDATQ
jgi:uncharacterized protein YigA (DUF484 family)